MDFLQARYYKPSKMLMSVTGQWPYQTVQARRSFQALVGFLFSCQAAPQIMAIFKYSHDPEVLIECFSPSMYVLICAAKFVNCVIHSRQVLKLLQRIRKDWLVWGEDQEAKILYKYTENARIFTLVYAVSVYSTAMLFMTQPLVPKIIDSLLSTQKNDSESAVFPFPVAYEPIDQEEYYSYLMAFSYVCVSAMTFSLIGADVMCVVLIAHCCGIFAALGEKLKNIGMLGKYEENEYFRNERDKDVELLVSCIDRHNDAIEFASIVEETYRWCFFLVLGCNMIMLSVTGYQIVTRTNDPQATIRYVAFVGAQMAHLYGESWLAQILTDHSEDIRSCLYDSEWYNISHNARKLLSVITMRSYRPCYLTAGKVCIMDVPTFGAVVKTSMSYFTILRSME